MSEKIKSEVRKVFVSLAIRAPFSYPAVGLDIKINDSLNVPLATNGTTIIVNPNLWNNLPEKQKLFVALREWLHITLLHVKRIKHRNQDIFSVASNFVVNWIIKNDFSDLEMPPKSYFDEKYVNKSVEFVYKDLLNNLQNNPESQKQNKAIKDIVDGTVERDVFELPSDVDEQQLTSTILNAAKHHKKITRAGNLPGCIDDLVKSLQNSNTPWTRLLATYAKTALSQSTDRNPFKADPKYLLHDMIVPSDDIKSSCKIVFVVDTSASIDKKEFEIVLGNLQNICTICKDITVIMTDVKIQSIIKIRNFRSLFKKGINFKGRGGTDLSAAFAKADDLRPDLIIVYSDLLFNYPPKPKSPVIFLTQNMNTNKPLYGYLLQVKS